MLVNSALVPLALVTACGRNNLASRMARSPEMDAQGQARCGVMKSSARPLIIEWPSSDRATLEGMVKSDRGLIAVRYEGCEMEVVRRCKVAGRYSYTAVEPKRDDQTFSNTTELYAKIPLGAAQLEAELERHGALSLAMTVAGQHQAHNERIGRAELSGGCEQATHVITGVTVGAFNLSSGAGARIGAGGGLNSGPSVGARSSAERGFERSDGDPDSCYGNEGGSAPTARCGALLRLEVEPILEPEELAAQRTRRPCPRGTVLVEGGRFKPSSSDTNAAVADFCMDLHEVTVSDYAACVDEGKCSAAPTTVQREELTPQERSTESELCNGDKVGRGRHPVNCVSWHQAESYCRTRGGRLPSEYEWEWAARGGPQERSYAWGEEEPGPRLVNACGRECGRYFQQAYGKLWRSLFAGKDGAEGTAKVGEYPRGAGRDRVQDLAGNVWEWTASVEELYRFELDESVDGGGVQAQADTSNRVIRGGGFMSDTDDQIRVTARAYRTLKDRRADVGFRCVKEP